MFQGATTSMPTLLKGRVDPQLILLAKVHFRTPSMTFGGWLWNVKSKLSLWHAMSKNLARSANNHSSRTYSTICQLTNCFMFVLWYSINVKTIGWKKKRWKRSLDK